MYDFSKMTNRFNTNSYKWDVKENELPMWVADMDFETAPAIINALHKRVDHKIFGYNTVPDDYFEAYQKWWERRHHFHMEKDWMMFVTGVVPAISSVVRKVTTVGENVLIMSPVYNIFYNSILNNGRHVLSSDLVFDGKEYHMTQHGFARHNEFEIKNQSQTEVTFTLVSNDEIIKQYPFLFELNVTYKLVENTLTCFINVKNKDHQTIYFQVGGHPAFACPFMENESSNDYYVEFAEYETRNQKVIDVDKRGMSHVQLPFFDHEKRFFVRQQLFNNDAIVIKDFKSENISIKSLNHQKSIVFHMQGFDHVGLWTAKHVGGLLAIEPWIGHADYVDFDGEFKEKESCVALDTDKEFNVQFAVEINQ